MIPETLEIVSRSLSIAIAATFISALIAVPAALLISLAEFRGKRAIVTLSRALLGVPSVVIGLVLYLLFTPTGPLGALDLLYTPRIMVIAQAILAFPIILALAHSSVSPLVKPLADLMMTLGAGTVRIAFGLIYETRRQLSMVLIMAFSRVIGETGMALMVGGNIHSHTRVMTTAITLETLKGNFELAVRLGLFLFAVAVVLNIILQLIIKEPDATAL